jgi:hypothetical protein
MVGSMKNIALVILMLLGTGATASANTPMGSCRFDLITASVSDDFLNELITFTEAVTYFKRDTNVVTPQFLSHFSEELEDPLRLAQAREVLAMETSLDAIANWAQSFHEAHPEIEVVELIYEKIADIRRSASTAVALSILPPNLHITKKALQDINRISDNQIRVAVERAFIKLSVDRKMPSLGSHKLRALDGASDRAVFSSYVTHGNGAYRALWSSTGLSDGDITVLRVVIHDEYDQLIKTGKL